MFLEKIVFVAFTCTTVTNYVFVAAQENDTMEDTEEEKPPPPLDNHTFVALIDIVFTDGRKRTCTGTIIHDNVVVTAAHCFANHDFRVEPELTASFVVIGTKKMYDTGYENYLPIERVITHPRYKGWTADIALVYTFAGMTSDKPGNVIPLIGERAMTPVDSNVTIISWGHCKDETPPTHTRPPVSARPICDSSEEAGDNSCEPKTTLTPSSSNIQNVAYDTDTVEEEDSTEKMYKQRYNREREVDHTGRLQLKAAEGIVTRGYLKPERMVQYRTHAIEDSLPISSAKDSTPRNDFQFSSSDEKNIREKVKEKVKVSSGRHRYHKILRNSSNSKEDNVDNFMVVINTEDLNFNVKSDLGRKGRRIRRSPFRDIKATEKRKLSKKKSKPRRRTLIDEGNGTDVIDSVTKQTKQKKNIIQTYFKDWRRQMGSKQNRLMVEVFGFVNVQTCKKLVERALPSIYSINPNHVVCYATEDHYITDEDSGAPAIRQGHLVAVTVGGVECEGDHVAIGMKMSCFCTWIAENIPGDAAEHMNCCKDCCNGASGDEPRYFKNLRIKTKYLNK